MTRSSNIRRFPLGLCGAVVAGVLGLTGYVCALHYLYIGLNGPEAGPGNVLGLRRYWLWSGCLWGALSALALVLVMRLRSDGFRVAAGVVVLGVAAVARMAVVLTTTPQLSDDIWRYIHDGGQLVSGVNPYAFTPSELRGREDASSSSPDSLLDRINHPELVTIYLPVSQYTFAGLSLVQQGRLDPMGDRTFRVGFAVIDLLIVVLLLARLRRGGLSAWWAALYAWHPLVIGEVAHSGHQDVIGIALLLGALLLFERAGGARVRMGITGAVFAGACLVKPFVLPLAIPMAWRAWRERAGVWPLVVGAVVSAGVLIVPFVLMEGGLTRLFDTAQQFVGHWAFNSPVHAPLAAVLGSKAGADVVCAAVVLGVALVCAVRGVEIWRTAGVILLVTLLVSSTVYPWYLLWALVFVPVRFQPGAWVLSLTLPWSYEVLGHPERWQVDVWLVCLQFVPVFFAVGLGLIFGRRVAGWSGRHLDQDRTHASTLTGVEHAP